MSLFKKKAKILWEPLLFSVSIPLAVGFFGGLVTSSNIPTWYATLNKPFFNPPNWIFAPVWTALYIMMGLSMYFVYAKLKLKPKIHCWYKLYACQLTLNFIWSLVFFGLKLPGYALLVILVLWYCILQLINTSLRFKLKLSANLLYPYLAWVSFATLLNIAIVTLN